MALRKDVWRVYEQPPHRRGSNPERGTLEHQRTTADQILRLVRGLIHWRAPLAVVGRVKTGLRTRSCRRPGGDTWAYYRRSTEGWPRSDDGGSRSSWKCPPKADETDGMR